MLSIFTELNRVMVEKLSNEERSEEEERMENTYKTEQTASQQQCEYNTEHKVNPL